MAALEERHAVRLFDRVGRRVVLTDAGKLFLSEARAVVARAEQANRLLDDLAGMKRGTLRLGASQTIANYWLPPLMQRFRKQHSGIALELAVGNSTLVAQMVRDATIDLGFVEGEITDAALNSQSLPGDQLALVVAPGHEWQHRPPSEPEDLKTSPWVMRELGSGTRSACEKVLMDQGLSTDDIEVAFELPSNEALCVAAEVGAGAAILSTLVVAPAVKANRLVSVDFKLLQRPFYVLHHKERHLSLAEQRFLDLL